MTMKDQPTLLWCIEKISQVTKQCMGVAFHYRTRSWRAVSDQTCGYLNKQGAIAHAEEFGLTIGKDVVITDHLYG